MFENMTLSKKVKIVLLVPLGVIIGQSLYSILYLGDDLKIVLGAAIIMYALLVIVFSLTILAISSLSKKDSKQ